MRSYIYRWLLAVAAVSVVLAAPSPAGAAALETPVAKDDLDGAAYADWVDGAAHPRTDSPEVVLWTKSTAPIHTGVRFGDSKTAGLRHLRIAFKRPVAVGSVLVRAGERVRLAVLKAGAAYPGDVAKESDWTGAARVGSGEVALWVLPPKTETRALRFSCESAPADRDPAGWLGGAYVLAERFTNLAPRAAPIAGANPAAAARIVDGKYGSWADIWDNGKDGGAAVVSPEHPEWVMLVWPEAVRLQGLSALWAGFSETQVQVYAGPSARHPREAAESDWRTVKTFPAENQYPRTLGPNWMDFGETVATRAVRLRITRPINEAASHGHLKGNSKDGKRVWLGELLALQLLGDAAAEATAAAASAEAAVHPPIPVRFRLKEPGYVTLVIEDAEGKRVRNLVSETPFPAGENVAWWDGLDDAGRDQQSADHGVYHIPGEFVKPSTYRVRGLTRRQLDLKYQMTIYNPGVPPWPTADHTGGWLADHTPPSAVLFVPGDKPRILVGSFVAEGGDGLAFLNLEGRKIGGIHWLGGNWTGSSHLARDAGERGVPGVYAYSGSAWENDTNKGQGEIRLVAVTDSGARNVLKYTLEAKVKENGSARPQLGGLAVHNGLLVAGLGDTDQLLFVKVAAESQAGKPAQPEGKVFGVAPLAKARGLAFDRQGRLLALVDTQLHRYALGENPLPLPQPEVLVAKGLEDPQQVALDEKGNIYVSDRGNSHQVKVFAPDGKFLRAIGTPGTPKAGRYDPNHMNNPNGVTISGDGRLWVAETDYQPKRVSVWTLDGKLVSAFYGPPQYGGGGDLDPKDRTRFYYNGMEFKLDWKTGTSQLASVFYRPAKDDLRPEGHMEDGPPQTAVYVKGRQYFTNSFNSHPTNGTGVAFIWLVRDGVAAPVAAIGRTNNWARFKTDPYKTRIRDVAEAGQKAGQKGGQVMFIWTDLNGDAQIQEDEVTFACDEVISVVIMPDLSAVTGTGKVFRPQGFTKEGAPIHEIGRPELLVSGAQHGVSTGGGQAMLAKDGWTIMTTAPKPWKPQSMGGALKGQALWSYPSCWPGLHASHSAPVPQYPGELVGTTRLLGHPVTPKGSDAGEIWAVNGNKGTIYLFTTDGLFVATLFKDSRLGTWAMPTATRGMLLNDCSIHEEDFWPSITQTEDGAVHLVVGVHTTCTLVSVEGLETIRRLPETRLTLTAKELEAAQQYFVERDAKRVAREGRGTLQVAIRKAAPKVDGSADDWAGADWATIDQRITQVGDWGNKPDVVTAAVAVAGDRLYAVFRTNDANLLRNTGEAPQMMFKTGGALDLMIGANPSADVKRQQPVAGDLRLLVTLVKGKTRAMLYRPVVPGTKEAVAFSSPWRTTRVDRVDDVSEDLEFAASKDGVYEFSVPLEVLGLVPKAGEAIQGDVGILRGDGIQTLQRVYWQNKATGLTADVPGEAMLTPALWGRWQFVGE